MKFHYYQIDYNFSSQDFFYYIMNLFMYSMSKNLGLWLVFC